jgi:hypothetical protein
MLFEHVPLFSADMNTLRGVKTTAEWEQWEIARQRKDADGTSAFHQTELVAGVALALANALAKVVNLRNTFEIAGGSSGLFRRFGVGKTRDREGRATRARCKVPVPSYSLFSIPLILTCVLAPFF